jgi:hypothetical protein
MIRDLLSKAPPPRLGVIGLGIKEQIGTDREHPKEVDYFVLPHAIPGVVEHPTSLEVMLPSDDPEAVFPTGYVRYNSAKVCTRVCDGTTFTEIPMEGRRETGSCWKTPGEPCECKATAKGRLSVVLLNGPVGIYQVVIGGERRCASLMKQLVLYRGMFGRLTGLVFRLERIPTKAQITDQKGRRMSRTGYPVHLLTDLVTRDALTIRAAERIALPAGLTVKALGAAPESETPVELDDAEHVVATGTDEPPETVAEEWTIERCFRAAERIGVGSLVYRAALAGLYGSGDNLTPAHLAEQRDSLERAEQDGAFAGRLSRRLVALAEGAEVRR